MKVITANEIENIKQKYQELKDYTIVARVMHLSPSTIRKYLDIPDNTELQIIRFNRLLPEFDIKAFMDKDWSTLCTLTEQELENLPQIWREMEL